MHNEIRIIQQNHAKTENLTLADITADNFKILLLLFLILKFAYNKCTINLK